MRCKVCGRKGLLDWTIDDDIVCLMCAFWADGLFDVLCPATMREWIFTGTLLADHVGD